MKVRIERVEQYPVYIITTGESLEGNDVVELSEDIIKWIRRVEKDYKVLQILLENTYLETERNKTKTNKTVVDLL